MSKQHKNGSCSCWDQVDQTLAEQNTRIGRSFGGLTGRHYIMIVSEKVDTKKRGKPRSIMASFCPFCGKKLKSSKK